MDLNTQQQLNISVATTEKLAKLHLTTLAELVLHLPLRYEDETHITPIAQTIIGQTYLIEGLIIKQQVEYKPRKQLILQIKDCSDAIIFIRLIHFYPNQLKQYTENIKIRAFGEIRHGFYGVEMVHPKINTQFSSQLNDHLTPIYPTVNGLSQRTLSTIIDNGLKFADLEDYLPDTLLKKYDLIDFKTAINLIHKPTINLDSNDLLSEHNPAIKRLKFDELLAQQLSMKIIRAKRNQIYHTTLEFKKILARQLIDSLPFKLTKAQDKVLTEIEHDLSQNFPMHRLLQGDVGSGKTIVAAISALFAIEAGYQVALIAPTEILAEQHYAKFNQWFKPLNISVAWLSGSQNKKEKVSYKNKISSGDYAIVIGTHALIQKDVHFAKLGLIIVDEQHRFGVNQRLELKQKGANSHQLMMSATPIPRTLSMTYFADVDVSVIDELPPNRTPIKTILINTARRNEIEQFVRHKIQSGKQVYWVCPLIEESESLQLQTAIETQQLLQQSFPELNIGLVHGKLKSKAKTEIMQQFYCNQIQLLVATTVIEVGVDVPNASTMVIEHAERMGLSQLHQLRGRIGRGEKIASECILLFAEPLSELAKKRLKIIFQNNDGFAIAREDLLLRGPGEFLGAKQSGIPLLRFADINADLKLMELARNSADELINTAPEIVEKHLNRWLPNREDYLEV